MCGQAISSSGRSWELGAPSQLCGPALGLGVMARVCLPLSVFPTHFTVFSQCPKCRGHHLVSGFPSNVISLCVAVYSTHLRRRKIRETVLSPSRSSNVGTHLEKVTQLLRLQALHLCLLEKVQVYRWAFPWEEIS